MNLASVTALWRPAIAFLGTFARFAGRRGWIAVSLVGFAALLDGAGIILLIPIVEAVVSPEGGHLQTRAVLDGIGVQSPLGRLAVLLAAFVSLSLLRAMVQYARDIWLALLQGDFGEHERNRVMRMLAAAPWSRIAALSHARVTRPDQRRDQPDRIERAIPDPGQRRAGHADRAGHACLRAGAGACADHSSRSSWLAAARSCWRRAASAELGSGLVDANHKMIGSATGFLGGLKAATAQNAQNGFVEEFAVIQRSVRGRQVDFMRRQARGRRLFAIGSTLMAAAVVLTGYLAAIPGRDPDHAGADLCADEWAGIADPDVRAEFLLQPAGVRGDPPARERPERQCRPCPQARNARRPGRSNCRPCPTSIRAAAALHPADLRIEPGSFIGITGPLGRRQDDSGRVADDSAGAAYRADADRR